MDDILETSGDFWRRAGRTEKAHYLAAESDARRHRAIGIPSVILSTVVATSIFSTLSENVEVGWRIATGVVALVTTVLASLQAFLRFGDRSGRHKLVAARYGNVRRDIDLFQLRFRGGGSVSRDEALAALETIRNELNSLATDSPTLPESVYLAGKEAFDNTHP